MENKTHWKKNLDSRFISGEDLKSSLNGLSPEMTVTLEKFSDQETFDQNQNAKTIVTGLFFKGVYKPAILNRTNAKFFIKETNSELMEDWIGKTVVMFAQKDQRHGFVVRFKSFAKPNLIKDTENFEKCKKAYQEDNSMLVKIKEKYNVSAEIEKLLIS